MECPVRFQNRTGQRLIGILSVPERPTGVMPCGVVLMNIGLHYRVCHNRLFVKLARFLCGEGYYVLRFDTHGVGDSEGEIEAGSVLLHFDRIQSGLFVDDTRAALDHLWAELGLEQFVLAGLCGGALTAVHTAAVDRRVVGVVFIAGPMTLTSPTEDEGLHPWEASQWLKGYVARIGNPGAWLRLASGKSDYRMMARSIGVRLRERWADLRSRIPREGSASGLDDRFNREYLHSFERFVGRGGKVLFVFPELDKTAGEFEDYFRRPVLMATHSYDGAYEVEIIERANHSFTLVESQERLKHGVLAWLRKR
jgi:pimeloyl-ACP methyl ester carboxylesterase